MFDVKRSALVVIDIQDGLLPKIHESQKLIQNSKKIIQAFRILDVPVFWLEQYPKGLGRTNSSLLEVLEGSPIEKTAFSGYFEEHCIKAFDSFGRDQVYVIGMETHICVYQTVMDLLASGKEVSLICDAVSSRDEENKKLALLRLSSEGVKLSCMEMVFFELMRNAKNPVFKEIQSLIK